MVVAWTFLSCFTFLMFPYSLLLVFSLFSLFSCSISAYWQGCDSELRRMKVLGFLCSAIFSFHLLSHCYGLYPFASFCGAGLLVLRGFHFFSASLLGWTAVPDLTKYSLFLFLSRPCLSVPVGHSRWLGTVGGCLLHRGFPVCPTPTPALSGFPAFLAYLHKCLFPSLLHQLVPWQHPSLQHPFSFPLLPPSLPSIQDPAPSLSRGRSRGLIFILTREIDFRSSQSLVNH